MERFQSPYCIEMVTSSFLRDLFVKGALAFGGSWGGPECAKSVSPEIHMLESFMWITICAVLFIVLRMDRLLSEFVKEASSRLRSIEKLASERPRNVESIIDKVLAFVHIGMYIQLVYYKINFSACCMLLQPCHLILLLEGIALASDGPLGVAISAMILPSLTGTLLALFFPDTTGLDQPFEEISYWIQHYLIIVVPFYLLLRKGGLALQLSSWRSLLMGLWVLTFLHFTLYEGIDLYFLINVEFMLCPSGAMNAIFGEFPSWLFYPSYRTTLAILVWVVGSCLTGLFIALASLLAVLLGIQNKKVMQKVSMTPIDIKSKSK